MQELTRLSEKYDENVLDATKKFEKLIVDKKEIEGLPATALGMAAQTALSKVFEIDTVDMYSLVTALVYLAAFLSMTSSCVNPLLGP